MRIPSGLARFAVAVVILGSTVAVLSQTQSTPRREVRTLPDAVQDAQTPREVAVTRPEQQKTAHDRSDVFSGTKAEPSSPVLNTQPEEGKVNGFDFARDPLNAKRPMQTFEEIMRMDVAAREQVMAAQRRLLESRYDLTPRLDRSATMSRGKPLPVGPTARLKQGLTWERLASMTPAQIREQNAFPYPTLPHPKHVAGGQVFPQIQIDMFPRLQRFDVDFDLPDAVIPNPTDDRKSAQPSLGVACLDCHVNGHTTAQFHLNPDDRPQHRRFRLDTTSIRGLFNQQIHGSKRSLRSVEDFTEFEQRTAYFNGDPIHAMKKGFFELNRVQVSHMAQMQNMFDFPPAPKLNPLGRLDASIATPSELRGEAIFF